MSELPKACVILGAGASCDVHGEGSVLINSEYRPPLASELFDIENNPAYFTVLRPYPGAKALTQQIAPIIKSGQISIEKELLRYSTHQSPEVRLQFKHIPAYLRDLLYLSSTNYTSVPSSYSQLVHQLLAEHPHEVLFITLNYDNLLETALNLFDPELTFRHITHYVHNERTAKVVKLHGSINWFTRVSHTENISWIDAVKKYNIAKQVNESDLSVVDSIRVVGGDVDPTGRFWMYPILTAPLASKGISDAVCPQSHIEAAKEYLKDCRKFLIIGTSGLDDDLLAFLDSSLEVTEDYYLIHVVGMGGNVNECRIRFRDGVKAFNKYLIHEPEYKLGFRDYIRHHLKSFAGLHM